ncbi:LicD family-domain-containing protein [Hypoxylon sp. FL1284]|nr:LicD family-domain-containing protein [Hypoxylon sp. FL1284]
MHIFLPFLMLLAAATAAPPNRASRPGSMSVGDKRGKTEVKQNHQQPQETKYFHEAGMTMELGHYDVRFFRGEVSYEEHILTLRRLVRAWLATVAALGVDAWLAHGTLLGWWWNGRVMPWDYDLDVQMPAATLAHLARHYNRTLHDYVFLVADDGNDDDGGLPLSPGPELQRQWQQQLGNGSELSSSSSSSSDGYAALRLVNKTYLLDVNPYHGAIGRGAGHNVIDARWIDTSTGMFVDVTALRERDVAARPGVWSCKNAHRYRTAELFPLRRTVFEGVPAAVPFAFDKMLVDEYGAKSLVTTQWEGHHWAPERKEWVKDPETHPKEDEAKRDGPQKGGKPVVVVVEKTVIKGTH